MSVYWQATLEDRHQTNAIGMPEQQGPWIYDAFYGLSQPPFALTPDPQFLFNHYACQNAINTLFFAVRSGEGFIKVVGEVGTGKTVLCRAFLGLLGNNYITAYIPNPYMDPMTLLRALADELGVANTEGADLHHILKALTDFLVDSYARYRKVVVVCLDEAHALPTETMEALRLLSNLETPKRKLLQLVLFGQPELDSRLDHPAVRQLTQRIAFSCRLIPLTRDEVEDYVSHRLQVAGYRGPRLFTRGAMALLALASAGVPRLVNILAHKALTVAFGEGSRRVTAHHLHHAIADTESVRAVMQRLHRQRLIFTGMSVAVVTVMLAAAARAWGLLP